MLFAVHSITVNLLELLYFTPVEGGDTLAPPPSLPACHCHFLGPILLFLQAMYLYQVLQIKIFYEYGSGSFAENKTFSEKHLTLPKSWKALLEAVSNPSLRNYEIHGHASFNYW